MNNELMFSSKTSEWQTPRELFDYLDSIFHFTLDPAATDENALCKKYYTEKEDGLAQSWKDEIVFVNPPYGRKYNRPWAQKINEEGQHTLVVALVSSRTGSSWFQDYITKANYLVFLRGRLKFGNSTSGAPFDSCIAIWDNSDIREIYFCHWEEIDNDPTN